MPGRSRQRRLPPPRRGDPRAALERRCREALRRAPANAEAHHLLGLIALERGRLEPAVQHLTRAAEAAPSAAALSNLGAALARCGRFDEALARFEAALALAPGDAETHANRGAVLRDLGRPAAAVAALGEALALAPEMADVRGNLAGALADQGRIAEALDEYRRALADAPSDARLHSAYLLALHYDDGLDPETLFAAHRDWAARHASLPPRPFPRVEGGPQRRLRIGYLSPDLRSHSVAWFAAPVVAAHDRARVHVTCYADGPEDAVSRRIACNADRWRPVAGLDDEALGALIRRDGIDVLVDLAGHTAGNRLRLLAARAAPVQASWLGYPDTTGLSTIDGRLTDDRADPPGKADGRHTEPLVRLRGGFLAYGPPPEAPPPAPRAGGPPTFGSFNALAKLSDATVALWARLLAALPEARLVLKAAGLDEDATAAHTCARFAAEGVAPDRLALLGRSPTTAQHLARYHEIDVALDPLAYNGTTTSCEALWMGVPVVTLAGDRHCRRVGASLLARAGLEDLIAHDEASYIRTAVTLARDRQRLAALRQGLRARMAPLTDADGLAGALEEAYRELWRARAAA